MKKILLALLIAHLFFTTTFAGTKFILSSSLDKNKMPADNLSEIPYDKAHQYYLFLYQDDKTVFGVEKVFFELFKYNASEDKYQYDNTITVSTQSDWGYCYRGIYFKDTGKYKIRVFTPNAELVTKYIEVVNK